MMKIFLPKPKWGRVPLLRQTCQYSGITEKATYHVKEDELDDCDYALIIEPCKHWILANVNKNIKVIFMHMENKDIWTPSHKDLTGIDTVISPYIADSSYVSNTRYLEWFPCVPWFYGISFATNQGLLHQPLASSIELDEMHSMCPPKKTKLLSMIVSGKEGTAGHKWRRAVAVAIKEEFKECVGLYGFGENPVSDKRIALDQYVYSIVIENSASSFYVTEKVVDCLIAWTIPIYSGAENVDQLLGANVPRIPYGCSPEKAVSEVKRVIRRAEWNEQLLRVARLNAMNELNFFEALPRILENG